MCNVRDNIQNFGLMYKYEEKDLKFPNFWKKKCKHFLFSSDLGDSLESC